MYLLWLSSFCILDFSISLHFSLAWSYSTSPHQNCLLLICSPRCDILLLIYLPHLYLFAHPCWNLILLVLIVFFLSWFVCFSYLRLSLCFSSSWLSWFCLNFNAFEALLVIPKTLARGQLQKIPINLNGQISLHMAHKNTVLPLNKFKQSELQVQ